MSIGTSHILIAYFSRTGHTRAVAKQIESNAGGDLFEIVPAKSYPTDYEECVNVAEVEQETNARPQLASHVSNMDDYDVIFLGYPIWCGTMPKVVFTFLEESDFSGKTIVPFCTHGGSRFGSSISDIAELCPASPVLDGLAVLGMDARFTQKRVSNWLDELGLTSNVGSVRKR